MSSSIRFLGLAILAWAGIRAVSLGMVPGTEALAVDSRPPRPASGLAAPMVSVPAPEQPPATAYAYPPGYGGYPPAYGAYPPYPPYGTPSYPGTPPQAAGMPYPVYIQVPAAAPRIVRHRPQQIEYEQAPDHGYFEPVRPLRDWNDDRLALNGAIPPATPPVQQTPSFDGPPLQAGVDRLSLSSWAMVRSKPGAQGLATSSTLGGSQAGARLLWRFHPNVAASLRTSSPINSQRGMEAALGLRYQPLRSIPLAVTLERRHAFGRFAGTSGFAGFVEGGLYGRPMPLGTRLDAYLQAGAVGFRDRLWFVDGSATLTRPIWRSFSGGLGVWGAAQRDLNRLDVGPRLSMPVGRRMRAHLDYRHQLMGNAQPGSGAVMTIAADF
jgi:hypothetical protein